MSPPENLEAPSAGVLAEAVLVPFPYELQRALLLQGPHAIIVQDTNEVVGEVALHTLEVESPRQSPEQGKSLLERRAQRQYVMCFDVLDVGKDERLELDGEVAKVSVYIVTCSSLAVQATHGAVTSCGVGRFEGVGNFGFSKSYPLGFSESFPQKPRRRATFFTSEAAMDTQNVHEEGPIDRTPPTLHTAWLNDLLTCAKLRVAQILSLDSTSAANKSGSSSARATTTEISPRRTLLEWAESDTVTYLRRGTLDILDAVVVQLPDVFTVEILPKLDMTDTLSLAQVNKAYNAAVWSADGVRSMEPKIKAHSVKIGKKTLTAEPLYWAAKHGNVPAVRARLESGEHVNKLLNRHNSTALHFAAEYGHAAVVKALIEAGADVNKPASPQSVEAYGTLDNVVHNVTPMYAAAQEGHTHVVMELIKAGADVNQADSEGFTPLHVAAQNGHDGIVALLIQAGAEFRKASKSGWTPMQVATRQKREKVVTLLKFYERV